MPLPPNPFAFTLAPGGGGPATASSAAGVNTAQSNPFNFDHSGWNVNIHSNGASLSAQGNTGANPTNQTPSGATGGLLGGGFNPMMLLIAAGAYLLLK